MRKNVGIVDAVLRGILAVILLAVSFAVPDQLLLSFLAAFFAIGLGASAMIGYCPLYTALHISTNRPVLRH